MRPKIGKDIEEVSFTEHSNDLSALEEYLGYNFKKESALNRALTHRSYSVINNSKDYERLEFLGDAVLDLTIAHLLIFAHPLAKEGDLSKMRAALVNTDSLANIGKSINLGDYIRLSRSELINNGRERASIIADVFEAIMAAIYLESGYEAAFNTTKKLFGNLLESVNPRDPKTELQEALHMRSKPAPVYELESVDGPQHAPVFTSVVIIDNQVVGKGTGSTKKASQQNAAEEALKKVFPNESGDNDES